MKNIRFMCDVGSTREKTPEGFLKATIRATRTGVMRYRISDVGASDIHGTGFVNVARLPEDLFSADSLNSLRYCSITDQHPDEMHVNANNYKRETIGHVCGDATHDNNNVYVPVIIKDAAAISAIENGHNEISVGPSANVVARTGIIDGQTYDYVLRDIEYNHISVVDKGRAGNARILDNEDIEMSDNDLKQLNDALSAENAELKQKNAALTQRIDEAETRSTLNDVLKLDPEFKAAAGATAKQIKVAFINDSSITESSNDELINYAFERSKNVKPEQVSPSITIAPRTTVNDASVNDQRTESRKYNEWED